MLLHNFRLKRFSRILLAIIITCSTKHALAQQPTILKGNLVRITQPLRNIHPLPATDVEIEYENDEDERWELIREKLHIRQLPYTPDRAIQKGLNLLPGSNNRLNATASAPQTFEGNGYIENNAAGLGGMPLDACVSVGPTQVVQMVNRIHRVYNKTGTPLTAPLKFSDIAPTATNDGDPITMYDQMADRWILLQFSKVGTSTPSLIFCVSATNDATGAYYVYDFNTPNIFPDYPHMAIWNNAITLTTHNFNTAGTAYLGQGYWAFDRKAMLSGAANPVAISFQDASTSGYLPVSVEGFKTPDVGTSPMFATYAGNSSVRLRSLIPNFINPAASTLSAVVSYTVNIFNTGGGATIALPGTNNVTDDLADRLMGRVIYRRFDNYESIILNHTVNVGTDVTPSTFQAAPRWYELSRSSPSSSWAVAQQSTYSPDAGNGATGTDRWMACMDFDQRGNLALGYSRASTVNNPDIYYIERRKNDAPNTLSAEQLFFSSPNYPLGISRWGDYSTMVIDPSDEETLWFTTCYYQQSFRFSPQSRIGSFTINDPLLTPTVHFTKSGTATRQAESTTPPSGPPNLYYKDYPVTITIDQAPSQPVLLSIAVSSSTGVAGVNYDLFNTSNFILNALNLSRSFTLRVYSGTVINNDIILNFSYTINANGGNAIAGTFNQTHQFTMVGKGDCPPVPVASSVAVCYLGSAVLTAPCNCSTTKWYDSTGTILLATGATYTPTNITAPVLFKARCEDQSGASSFVNVNVTLSSPPVYVTASAPLDFCNGDSVVLNSNIGVNNAINFVKASSQYITVPHSTSLNLAANFTIEAWVNYSGINSTIVDKGNYDFLFQLNANGNANKLGFYDRGGAVWIYSTDPVPQNTWTHVALTRNGNIITFYINGLASGSGTATGISQDALPMNIGRQQPSACQCNFFNGQMDELRIWNTTLTQAQIQARMRSGVPVNSTGLAAYYKFDEDAGTVTADATPNGNNGTLVNAPTRVVPSAAPVNTEFGNALTFVKASSQYITVPHSTSINLGGNYTIEAWINYSGLNSTIIDKGNYAYLFQVGANSNANKLGFYDRGAAAWIYSTGSVPQNTWTHVALRRTANVISFYINSIPAGSATVGVIYQDALAMNIGRQQPSACQCNYFNGAMDELRIWNVARTPAEIAANYYRSVAVNSPGLAAYYKFDEGTGTLTADATANGNNGTLVTGQVWQNPSGVTPPAITWTPGGAHTGTLTAKTTGTYTATYNMPGGCTSNVSVNVTARAKPALGPDITLYKDCVGDTTNLTGLFNTTGLFTTWNTANPNSVLPGTYRLIALNAQNSSCADTAYANIILEVATWTGAISGNWHIAGNWSIGKVPTAKTHVIFQPGTPLCSVSTGNAFAASIQVKNTNSVTVNAAYQLFIGGKCMVLPVIDNVRPALSTSITAYDNAAENSWVSVTQAEYNNLLTTVSGSAKYGSSESYMLTTPNNQWTGGYMVGGNPNPAKVPPSNYIIAWSVKTGVSASSALNSKLKVSASQTSGYADYGSALPDIGTIPANTRVFFVLKKPLVVTPASPAFTAVYNVTSGFLGATSGAGYGPEYFQGSDVSFFNSGSGAFDAYSQVICTGVRQW